MTGPSERDGQRPTSDPRHTLADQIAAELTASDKAYAKRAAAAARLDARLMQEASR